MAYDKNLVEMMDLLSDKYPGQHVCTISFQDRTVVSAHLDVTIARKKAEEKGYSDPVCFYVPMPGEKIILPGKSEPTAI